MEIPRSATLTWTYSYMELEVLEDAYITFKIEISFKPEKPDGLILFQGLSDKIDGDYISFGIEQGYPVFQYVV